jgi:invasion protein IalB
MTRLVSACLAAAFICTAAPAFAQTPPAAAPAPAAKLVQKFDNWQVFVHEGPGDKICFAAAQPKSMEPKAAKRGPVFFYLTTWAKDNVRNEISVKIGYAMKLDTSPVITIGKDQFELYPKDDKAFMRDPGEERKLLDAMKKGTTLTVKGVSARGTATTDQYSLGGLSAALSQLATSCP